jgi:hypothetical protein
MPTIDKVLQGVVAISIIIIFLTTIIPELVKATGVSIPLLNVALGLLVFGIIFAILKEFFK